MTGSLPSSESSCNGVTYISIESLCFMINHDICITPVFDLHIGEKTEERKYEC